jgi:hypothetical protein
VSFSFLFFSLFFYSVRIGKLANWEQKVLAENVFCRYLPTKEEYVAQLQSRGLVVESAVLVTDEWTKYTSDRYAHFIRNLDDMQLLHGVEICENLKFFYRQIADLFISGNVGGLRIVARKPMHPTKKLQSKL